MAAGKPARDKGLGHGKSCWLGLQMAAHRGEQPRLVQGLLAHSSSQRRRHGR